MRNHPQVVEAQIESLSNHLSEADALDALELLEDEIREGEYQVHQRTVWAKFDHWGEADA